MLDTPIRNSSISGCLENIMHDKSVWWTNKPNNLKKISSLRIYKKIYKKDWGGGQDQRRVDSVRIKNELVGLNQYLFRFWWKKCKNCLLRHVLHVLLDGKSTIGYHSETNVGTSKNSKLGCLWVSDTCSKTSPLGCPTVTTHFDITDKECHPLRCK